ncbi:MAG: DUF5615 family PIN-like protein [Nitrospira sp.]|nr:DUF5615 family PIN-like protein [Nitrospira sp.]
MKIKLDENLPAQLARALTALGHDTDTVPQEGLAGKPDPDIWAAAQTVGRFLILFGHPPVRARHACRTSSGTASNPGPPGLDPSNL